MRNKKKNWIAISLSAAGAGAGLMFLLDPNRGGRRRGLIGDKAVHLGKFMGKRLQRRGRDLGNRAQGILAETSARMSRETAVDEVLAQRVRSKIGRVLSHPRTIDVAAERGVVELRGSVLRSERRRAIRTAESVRGVRAVRHDALLTYTDEQGIPGYQPRSRPQGTKQQKAPKGRLRGLRLGIALASGAMAAYRTLKNAGPREKRVEHKDSSQRAA
jgi:hypothetical protein